MKNVNLFLQTNMNFTFLANPVFSESGSGMAVSGTVAASCTGGLVAASVIAVLLGGAAAAGWYLAYRYRVANKQLRANQSMVDLVRRYQRAPSSLERMLNDFRRAGFCVRSDSQRWDPSPKCTCRAPMMGRPRMATPATSVNSYLKIEVKVENPPPHFLFKFVEIEKCYFC